MVPAKPSLDLLRSLTDEHVLRALMQQRRSTCELAARTGLSKPTVSDSVRRLCEAGLLADTGQRTTGRGRAARTTGSPRTSVAPWWSPWPRRGSWPSCWTPTAT